MNKKEISELSRRFKLEKSNISKIYGCYVNSNKEVISYLDESIGLMPQEEAEQYLAFLKKVLSGAPGRNLTDIVFSTDQVSNSDEHRLLMALRDDHADARQSFFQAVIENLDMGDSNYLILCANDAYDVPRRGRSDNESDQVFCYFVCAICPVKDGKLELGYYSGENEFHNCLARQIVGAPELGFLFPAFDNRSTNIYNALFYSRRPDEIHYEFIEGVFRVDLAMTPAEQREAFESILDEAVECRIDVVRAVNEQLKAKVDDAEESISVSCADLSAILADSGATEEQLKTFKEAYNDRFGQAMLNPENIVDIRHFEMKAGEIKISVSPDQSFLVETREIDGKKYIMVPASEVELNGLPVKV